MGMEYSPYDVAQATSLKNLTYIYASMATFWTYDYACLIDKECTFLLHSRWTKVKALYIAARYSPFLVLPAHLYLQFIPHDNLNECQTLTNISSALSLVSIVVSGFIFILRTYALWNKDKIVLTIMSFVFLGILITGTTLLFSANGTTPYEVSAYQGITGCYQISDGVLIPYVLLTVHEFVLLLLTLVRAVQKWRMSSNTLLIVLLKHDVFYYACSLAFSVVNVLALSFFQFAYSSMFEDIQVIILAILSTRMHLHLWGVDKKRRIVDVPPLIRLSEMMTEHSIVADPPFLDV